MSQEVYRVEGITQEHIDNLVKQVKDEQRSAALWERYYDRERARNHVTTLWVAGLGTALVLTAVLTVVFGWFRIDADQEVVDEYRERSAAAKATVDKAEAQELESLRLGQRALAICQDDLAVAESQRDLALTSATASPPITTRRWCGCFAREGDSTSWGSWRSQ